MPPRFHIDTALQAGAELELPSGAVRHVQVLRLQAGAAITLFDGRGGEWSAGVVRMGRSEVLVRVEAFHSVERELLPPVTLALGMPANERMDGLVEKATELGAVTIQPLLCERSVLRLTGERALKKVAHWQAVAVAACEQCGRTRVPTVAPVRPLLDWLAQAPASDGGPPCARFVLSTRASLPVALALAAHFTGIVCLSGPEGGLTQAEEHAAELRGFIPITLGPRTLRADTAPLALLAHLSLYSAGAEPGKGPG
ncbi:MAG: 16S rRNA (uracil(1498)-N(3))-methyltransferase [Burkholderiaceae bacterium]